jgi:hypothetical protein
MINLEAIYSYCYLNNKRLKKYESLIARDANYSCRYADQILKDRFELGEEAISKVAACSYTYAKYVLKKRFILGEEAIKLDSGYQPLYEDVFDCKL